MTGQFGTGGEDFSVVRLRADGSPDTDFGTDGDVAYNFSGEDRASDIVLQGDGRIIVVGSIAMTTINEAMGIMRLNPDGTLDNTFANQGKLTLNPTAGHDNLFAVALQGEKILVGGFITVNGLTNFAVIRIDSTGVVDQTFGTDGMWSAHIGTNSNNYKVRRILVQSDSKIVLVSGGGATSGGGAVVRLTADGNLDPTFFETGIRVFTTLPADGRLNYSVQHLEGGALQDDGKIIVVGASNLSGSGIDFFVIRMNTDGSLDTTFDFDGYRSISPTTANSTDRAYDVRVQQNGKIIVTGLHQPSSNRWDFSAVRLLPNGSNDPIFGNGGGEVYDLSGTAYGYPDPDSDDYPRSMA